MHKALHVLNVCACVCTVCSVQCAVCRVPCAVCCVPCVCACLRMCVHTIGYPCTSMTVRVCGAVRVCAVYPVVGHSGQLGQGDLARRLRPALVQAFGKVKIVKIASGEIHAAALDVYVQWAVSAHSVR